MKKSDSVKIRQTESVLVVRRKIDISRKLILSSPVLRRLCTELDQFKTSIDASFPKASFAYTTLS